MKDEEIEIVVNEFLDNEQLSRPFSKDTVDSFYAEILAFVKEYTQFDGINDKVDFTNIEIGKFKQKMLDKAAAIWISSFSSLKLSDKDSAHWRLGFIYNARLSKLQITCVAGVEKANELFYGKAA